MSFETSTYFLSNTSMQRQHDDLTSISSQIVVGKVPKIGTNMCDVFFSAPKEEDEIDQEEQ
jgi:hypothetical protein